MLPTCRKLDRGEVKGFADTVKEMVAAPCPLCVLSETQSASAATVQVQSRSAEMVSEPTPPLAAKDDGVFEAFVPHFAELGEATEVVADVQLVLSAAAANRRDQNEGARIFSAVVAAGAHARASPAVPPARPFA